MKRFALCTFFLMYLTGGSVAEITIGAKSQVVSVSTSENTGLSLRVGPFLKNSEKMNLHLQVSTEFFTGRFDSRIGAMGSSTDFYMLEAILLGEKTDKFTWGPLVTLTGLYEYDVRYSGNRYGNWLGLVAGMGATGVLNLKNENVLSARLSVAGTLVNSCRFKEDSDSAEWIDSTMFEHEYHYSDAYLQGLKTAALEYDRTMFPIYWTLSYTKFSGWIFVGGGVNGFFKINYLKVEKTVDFSNEYSTFFHFGVRLRRMKNQ